MTATVVADRYELVRPLGHGAFGRTFLARDTTTGVAVALKVLDPRARGDWKARELFAREATVLRDLRHHGIPEVHAVLEQEWEGATTPMLVMEFVDGESLARLIEDRRSLGRADVLHLFMELLGILEYLHRRIPPILHRDIKPSNVLVRPDGTAALVDFGSVRSLHLRHDEAGSTIAGTFGYMPYEQFMGQASTSSDLFALAATFLHLVTGRPPRDFMTEDGRIEVPADLPVGGTFRDVLARMLRPTPAERFSSAREVREALLGEGREPLPSMALTSTQHAALPARRSEPLDPVLLEAVPRPFDGQARRLVKQLVPSAFDMMDTSAKRSQVPTAADWLLLGFFSTLTLGILPIVFVAISRSRRKLLQRFVREGTPAVARVSRIESEGTAFGEKMARVHYSFEADGAVHRDSDLVLPRIARRWQEGDEIHVLYIASTGYDSVVVSTG